MKKLIYVIGFILMISLLGITSCRKNKDSKIKDKIIGTWVGGQQGYDDTHDTLTFSSDSVLWLGIPRRKLSYTIDKGYLYIQDRRDGFLLHFDSDTRMHFTIGTAMGDFIWYFKKQ